MPYSLGKLWIIFNKKSYKNPGTSRHFLHEARETSEMSERTNEIDREAKAHGHTASMYVSEESDHVRASLWVEAWRKKIAQRDAVVVRYADDGD